MSIRIPPGARLGRYEVKSQLGAGGMGEVYLAEDTTLSRKVALKLLGAEFTQDRDRLRRFEQEASAASSLNHPNILTIYEVGFADGHHFIATELVDGQTLRKRLAGARLEIHEVLDIGMQVAGALEEAHAAGIVHRDIKPENIMVRHNGYVKVLDFGLAKLTEQSAGADSEALTRALIHTDAGKVMGTSHYMSPEQARGKGVDARTDIWSLGVVLYEMIAGRIPFEGETATDVLFAIAKTEAPPLARYAQNVPIELDWIVMKALRKDVEDRYQTARELHSDLKKLKQRLEFQAELERSVPPERISSIISGPLVDSATAAAAVSSQASGQVPVAVSGQSTAAVSGAVTTRASSAEYIVSEIKRHKTGFGLISAGVLALAIIVVASYLWISGRRAHALTDKDTILLADFVNTTGDPVFDGTLKQALAVQLGQSPFLNIFGDDRVRDALRLMGRSPDERVTRDIAREICQRQGLKALLAGSISGLGSHYVITLEAINAQTGDAIAREQAEANSKEEVLKSLGEAATKLREKLGESLATIQKFDAPVGQATTSSLEALKAFSLGAEQRAKGNQPDAIPFFKRAIELDSNFAVAYGRLAAIYRNQGQTELAAEYGQKAFELKDRVSEREKFYISQGYYGYVTGEIDETINVLKAWAQTYPNDYIPHQNLGVYYSDLGQHEEAIKETRESLRLNPNDAGVQGNLVDDFRRLNRYDEARQVLETTLGRNPDTRIYHNYSYQLAFLRGDQATMKRDLDWYASKSDEIPILGFQRAEATVSGQLKKGRELSHRRAELFKSQGRKENAAQNETGIALGGAVTGNCEQVKENVNAALTISRGKFELTNAALALALCNQPGQAQPMIDELSKRYPKDTSVIAIFLPEIRATIENNRGNPALALQLLQPTTRYERGNIDGFWLNYIRGQAYLRQRSGTEAAAEFQKILDHRGVDPFSLLYPLAQLGLARAAVLQGDTAKARKAYQDFFALWKDADPDIPILIEAKKEYETLK